MSSTKGRGFASMDAERQREIASKGGRAAHQKGTAHEFSSDEARQAGRKGGQAVSQDRAHMAAIGREGGFRRGRTNAIRRQTVGPAGLVATSSDDGGRSSQFQPIHSDSEENPSSSGFIIRDRERLAPNVTSSSDFFSSEQRSKDE